MARLASSREASTNSAGVVSSEVRIDGRLPRHELQGGGRVRAMSTPWSGDACSLVDALRAKVLSPLEALDDCIAAIERSPLNAFSHTDFDRAREAAELANVTLPFGGVPFGVKERERVEGWPYAEASVLFKDRVADVDDTSVTRLRTSGAILAAQTTSPEFGAINCTSSVLYGTTRNPWNQERTPGGRRGARPPPLRVGSCPSPPAATAGGPSGDPRDSAACSG